MHPTRQGSTLFTVVVLLGVIAVLIASSAYEASAVRNRIQTDLVGQRSRYAAESVAALKESELVALAAANDLARLAAHPYAGDPGTNGQVFPAKAGAIATTDPWEGSRWFNNCLVRWRIEPVMVANNSAFSINPHADLSRTNPANQNVDADAALESCVNNYEFYNFRIATEAHYLTDPADAAATPWSDPTQRICVSQAVRQVQLRLNSLFKYALFFASEGTTGDMELWAGTTVTVDGAVHSNGAIYIGGQGVNYLTGNYHNAASAGGGLRIGQAGKRTTVTGINGIFRLRKGCNVLAFRNSTHPLYNPNLLADAIPDPMLVPPPFLTTAGATITETGISYPTLLSWGANQDLNGDDQTSSLHQINGVNFTSRNDSRNPGGLTGLTSSFGAFVRDGVTRGASVVKTLSNIPYLAGRPFEPQRLAAKGTRLYQLDPYNAVPAKRTTQLTVVPNTPSAANYANPSQNNYQFVTTATPPAQPVTATSDPMYYVVAKPSTATDAVGAKKIKYAIVKATPPVAISAATIKAVTVDQIVNCTDNLDAVSLSNFYITSGDILRGSESLLALYGAGGTKSLAQILREHPEILPLTEHFPDAEGLPLFTQTGTWQGLADISDPAVGSVDADGFPLQAEAGHYLTLASQGEDGADSYGLVIRERPAQTGWIGPPPGEDPYYSNHDAMVAINPTQTDGTFNNTQAVDSGQAPVLTFRVHLPLGTWYASVRGHGHSGFSASNQHKYYMRVCKLDGTQVGNLSTRNFPGGLGDSSTVAWEPANNDKYDVLTEADYQVKIYMGDSGVAIDKVVMANSKNLAAARQGYSTSSQDANGAYLPTLETSGTYNGQRWLAFEAENFLTNVQGSSAYYWIRISMANQVRYLAGQWAIRFHGVDITRPFLYYGLLSATAVTDLTMREDQIIDLRESTAMRVFCGLDPSDMFGTTDGTATLPYRVQLLTLNLAKVCAFLKNTSWTTIDSAYSGSQTLKDHFNGLIYAHRTRRSQNTALDPVTNPGGYFDPARNSTTSPATKNPIAIPSVGTGPNYYANYPHAYREFNGPPEVFHTAFRLTNGSAIDWGGKSYAGTYWRTRGLTFVTPNRVYVWKDFNTTTYPDSAGASQIPPCAVFADCLVALSNAWDDAFHQSWTTSLKTASTTTFNLSLVINNRPTDPWNAADEGSGAVANVVRFLEDWGGMTYNFKGSLVVMNQQRYAYDTLGANKCTMNNSTSFYSPPSRSIVFNTDLLQRVGQPPFTPFGVQVIRTVQTVDTR